MGRAALILGIALSLIALSVQQPCHVNAQESRYPAPPSPIPQAPSPSESLTSLENLHQALESGGISGLSRDALDRHFSALSPLQSANDAVADVLEDPRVGFQVGAEVSAKAHKFFNAKLEMEGNTVKGGLENKYLGFTFEGTPDERKMGATFTLGTGDIYGDYEFKRQLSVEFSYDSNEKYIKALGADVGNLPGARTVLNLMNRKAKEIQPADGSPPLKQAISAAVNELKSMMPPNFEAGSQFETMTVGSTASVSRNGVEIAHSKKERYRPSDGFDQRQIFSETKLGMKVEASTKGEVIKGGVSAGVTFSDDPERTITPERKAQAERIRKHGLIGEAKESLKKGIIADAADQIQAAGKAIAQLPRTAIEARDRILAVKDEKVGGVMLHFAPEVLQTGAPPAEVAAMLASFAENRSQHGTNFIVTAPAEEEDFHLVSLADLLSDPAAKTVGNLTRIKGCVIDPENGDIRIIGQIEAGREAISLDLLVVAMRAIWQEGGTPFISLDPIPGAEFGPQQSRVGGLAKDLRSSRFIRVMLDADYAMKQINLGTLKVDVPGFQSVRELEEKADELSGGMTRYWLYPKQASTADVWHHEEAGKQVLCFESEICILTERMHQVSSFATGVTKPDASAEEGARLFTEHYNDIADKIPVFHQLYGVFDSAKLAAVLKQRNAAHPLLDKLCQRDFEAVEIPESYQGIGPIFIKNSSYYIGGGARTKVKLSSASFAESDQIAVFFDAGPAQSIETSLPSSSVLLPGAARGMAAEVLVGKARGLYGQLKYREAKDLLNEALEADPSIEEALTYRALANFALGETDAALEDAKKFVRTNPDMRGFLGLMYCYSGDMDQALANVRTCRNQFPDDENALQWSATVHAFALQLDDAEAEADELIAKAPHSNEGFEVRSMVDTFRRIGPERAAAFVERSLRTPLPIAEGIATGSALVQALDFESAANALDGAYQLAQAAAKDPAYADLFLVERVSMALASSLSMRAKFYGNLGDSRRAREDYARAIEICDQLTADHPDWPSAHLLSATISLAANSDGGKAALDSYYKAREMSAEGDALMEDMALQLGADNAVAFFGLMLFQQYTPTKGEGEQIDLLKDVVELLGDGLAARIWSIPAKYHDKPNLASLKLKQLDKDISEDPGKLDPITLYSIAFLYTVLLGNEQDRYRWEAPPPESIDYQIATVQKFMKITDRSDMPAQMMLQIATFRMGMFGHLGMAYQKKIASDERTKDLVEKVTNKEVALEDALENARAVKAEVLEQAKSQLSPMSFEMVRLTLESSKLEEELFHAAGLVPPKRESTPAAQAEVAARFDQMAASVGSVMQLRTMLAFVDIFNKGLMMAPVTPGKEEEHARLVQTFAALRAKLTLRSRLTPPQREGEARPWLGHPELVGTKGAGKVPGPILTTSPLNEGSADLSESEWEIMDPLAIACAFGGGALVLLFVVLMIRRKRPETESSGGPQ